MLKELIPITINQEFEYLMDEYWKHLIENDIDARLYSGLKITRLSPVSYADTKADIAVKRQFIDKFESFSEDQLSRDQQISCKAILWYFKQKVKLFEYFWLDFPVCPYSFTLSYLIQDFPDYPLHTSEDSRDYITLLEDVARYIKDIHERMREQQEKGIFLSKPELSLVINGLKSYHLNHDVNGKIILEREDNKLLL